MYGKFGELGQCRTSAMNIYSIDKLKSLSKNDFILTVQKTNSYVSEQNILEFDSRF